jgi:hypothetical protein
MDNKQRVAEDTYDPHIVPAETASRKEREGENFKKLPKETESDLDTTGGYTVDSEGLVNNFAVEPEMYYETPGDAAAQEEAEKAERVRELADINDNDESGKLSLESDERGKGSGII